MFVCVMFDKFWGPEGVYREGICRVRTHFYVNSTGIGDFVSGIVAILLDLLLSTR
jgi:hypothetical protein